MNKTFCGRTTKVNSLLNLDRSDTHIHNIEAKRSKVNNDSAYLLHFRLGHIGVKRMKKLHADGLLESLDYESLDACEPCLMGIQVPLLVIDRRRVSVMSTLFSNP